MDGLAAAPFGSRERPIVTKSLGVAVWLPIRLRPGMTREILPAPEKHRAAARRPPEGGEREGTSSDVGVEAAMTAKSSEIILSWPEESREAAQLVIERYGESDEVTPTQLIWHRRGPWKRIVATRIVHPHNFPAPHVDCVQSVIEYKVPVEKISDLAAFDGSIAVERTAGEVSARCHDEQANLLALNLMHDIVTGRRSVEEARRYYAKEFADYRRKRPTPYMEKLRFEPGYGDTADPDVRILSDADLEQARHEGGER
jgi:hypothetical protein